MENVEAGSRLENVFFRVIVLPSGPVPVRRPPRESREELSKLIAASPPDAELYSLRALEAEQQLDFSAAEADWKNYAGTAADKGAARLALADYYHRRLESQKEFDALTLAAREYAPDSEKLLPVTQQRPWKTYERLIRLIDEQRLDPRLGVQQYIQWILRFPGHPELHHAFFRFAIDHKLYDAADQAIAGYQRLFPNEDEFPIKARAELAAKNGTAAEAIAIYDRSFRPLWPAALVTQYFDLLKRTGSLRAYLEKARAGVASNPADISSAARLFYYWQQQNNAAAAGRALAEFRERKQSRQSAWTAQELLVLARLYESIHSYDEAARNYYALYSAAQSDDAMAESALGSLARLLLSTPEQAIHFGNGNLALYRDVAAMDPHPGFLNGVLSLILNETDPANRYAIEEQSAPAYFHRARAAELVALFESRFPNSNLRAGLREQLVEAYAVYGANDAVIRAGNEFLKDFPNAPNRVAVTLRIADAYARLKRIEQEFSTYDSLLAELARRADGVPLGAVTRPPGQARVVRSPEYARVLDRYVARLAELKRVPDALVLYRREIVRNPNDPGLYDALAAFLDQNKLGAEIEQVYQRAIAQFQDHTWEHKLARWYVRERRQADVARLTRDVVRIFSGTELDAYFREVVNPGAPVGPQLYLQLNLYAHQRFPHHLSFVRNLLNAYSANATRDDSAYEALLRRYWYDAEDLRARFFEWLSRTGRLDAELSLVRTSNPGAALAQNPAAQRFLAEGEMWRSHFEAAAPVIVALAADYPADRVIGRRAASIERSLNAADRAIAVEARLSEADPRDRATLTRLGEIEADRERFDRAALYWNRIAEVDSARPESYLEAATVFWDYYRYDDALRVISQARQRLENPALFAYETGAIRENQRAYDFAVREYAKGAVAQPGSLAEKRLLTLARRPALRTDTEQLTENLVSGRNPETGALRLRVALLRDQNRRDDLEKLLLAVAGRTTSPELLARIENDARVDGFPKAQQAAIEREIAITTDPVERIRLRLGLARFFEGQGRIAEGAQTVDAVYRENPAILGVIRAAVDYHWRNKNARRAVDVLEEAAARAQPDYRRGFTVEASRKALEAADYARARGFAAKLLAESPANAEYIALMADTYARQGDDRGLRAFYDAKIREVGARSDQAAAMRRALIPVLTRMKDYAGAVDQYIEVLNRFPEDEGLAREAAQYASANGVAPRLRDFYTKAANDSPKDFRWPMVLARIQTQLEDFPSAIASYTRAEDVRPDRTDLLASRLNLEERLFRFDDAAVTAAKLYELSYRNPQWMEKLGEIRARQGRTADAVAAVTKAWIEGRPDRAENFLNAARELESWGLIAEARRFAEEAWKRSRADALPLYTRLLMRERQFDAALANLAGAGDETVPALREMGNAVAKYYSPEEKVRFEAAIASHPNRIEIAGYARLAGAEARWIYERMMADPVGGAVLKPRLIELQKRRLAFAELGSEMEAYDRALPPGAAYTDELSVAAAAYRATGDTAAELRVLELQHNRSTLAEPLFERYCQLLLARPPAMIAAIAREGSGGQANAMVNYVLRHANAAIAQQAIAARGRRLGPLWTKAYTALAGVYYASSAPAVRSSFTAILGDMNIGARIGKPLDRAQQLAGDVWFYYGGRFGEYLKSDDYLPAIVEATPGRSQAYFTLAEYYRDAGNDLAAAVDYRNALELSPSRADVHDRLAVIAAKAGRNSEAIQEWKLALGALTEMMNRARVPQEFWTNLSDTVRDIGAARRLAPLRDDIDRLMRVYVRRNGAFQVQGLMESALAAGFDISWVADLSGAAADPVQFLSAIIDQPWVNDGQKDILHRRIIESAQSRLSQSFGDAHTDAQSRLWELQAAYAEYLLKRGDARRASELVASFAAEAVKYRPDVLGLELRVAAKTGGLEARLAAIPEPVPVEILRNAANELSKGGDEAPARKILEFVYTRELKSGSLEPAAFLGLAEIRLAENNVSAALALLRRMALVSGEPFRTLDPAAALLEKTGHTAEAVEFLTRFVQAEPWNADARVRLASAQGSADTLAGIAKSPDAPYEVRVAAARAMRKLKASPLSGTEPELAALSAQALGDVDKPYWFDARIDAGTEPALAAAAGVNPNATGVKVALFQVASTARHDALAIAVGRELLPRYWGGEGEFTPWVANSFLNGFPDRDRVTVARGLGQAYQRQGDWGEAELYYRIAQAIGPADQIRRALDTVRARIELEAKNEARRPVVSDEVEQDRLVRARMTR